MVIEVSVSGGAFCCNAYKVGAQPDWRERNAIASVSLFR